MFWTSIESDGIVKIKERATSHDSGMIIVSENLDSATINIGTYDGEGTFVVIAEWTEAICFPHGRGIQLYAQVSGLSSNRVYIGYAG